MYDHYNTKNHSFQGWTKHDHPKNGGLLNYPGLLQTSDPERLAGGQSAQDNNPKKRPRTEESDDGASGSAMEATATNEEVQALREQNKAKDEEIESLKHNIEALTTQKHDLQAALDAKITELESRPTIEAVNELRETKNKEIDDLKTKHTKDIEALVKQHTEEIDDRISEKKHMQEYINTKNSEMDDLRLRPTMEVEDGLREYIDTKHAEIHLLKTTHTAAINAKNLEINGMTTTNTASINAKNTEIDDIKKKHDTDLQALRDDATKKDDNIKELEAKLTAAQTTIATLESRPPFQPASAKDINDLKIEYYDREKKLKNKHQDEITELEKNIRTLESNVRSLKADLEDSPPALAAPAEATLRRDLAKEIAENTTLRTLLSDTNKTLRKSNEYGNSQNSLYKREQQINLGMHSERGAFRNTMSDEMKKIASKHDPNQEQCCKCHRPKKSSNGGGYGGMQ
jgi:DNA repair exonuclease SbcCD ATPase subunit